MFYGTGLQQGYRGFGQDEVERAGMTSTSWFALGFIGLMAVGLVALERKGHRAFR